MIEWPHRWWWQVNVLWQISSSTRTIAPWTLLSLLEHCCRSSNICCRSSKLCFHINVSRSIKEESDLQLRHSNCFQEINIQRHKADASRIYGSSKELLISHPLLQFCSLSVSDISSSIFKFQISSPFSVCARTRRLPLCFSVISTSMVPRARKSYT